MNPSDGSSSEDDTAAPSRAVVPVLAYSSQNSNSVASQNTNLAVLRVLPLRNAKIAQARLQVCGIYCQIVETEVSTPAWVHNVQLVVAEADVYVADSTLNAMTAENAAGGFLYEPWRCPRCFSRELDALPQAGGYRLLQWLLIIVIALPLAVRMLCAIAGWTSANDLIDGMVRILWLPWLLTAVVLLIICGRAPRAKRCRECGLEWTNLPSSGTPPLPTATHEAQ